MRQAYGYPAQVCNWALAAQPGHPALLEYALSVLNHTSWEMFHTHDVVANHSSETAQKLKADMHSAYHDTIVQRTDECKCRCVARLHHLPWGTIWGTICIPRLA